jgi:hypothetical protein
MYTLQTTRTLGAAYLLYFQIFAQSEKDEITLTFVVFL